MQAADGFMHMLEDHDGPEHLVVFVTSDQDFGEKILELQRRNFKVVVLYHEPYASQRPVSIINAADEAHDWLPFLRQELGMPQLSISDYDASVHQPNKATTSLSPASQSAKSQAVRKVSPDRGSIQVSCCVAYALALHLQAMQHVLEAQSSDIAKSIHASLYTSPEL